MFLLLPRPIVNSLFLHFAGMNDLDVKASKVVTVKRQQMVNVVRF